MNTTIGVIFFIAITIAMLLGTGWWRYVLTGYLIARVTPYEQAGTGVGSILVVGDSTGYGTGASRSSESVAGRFGADYPGYSITNDSVNGRVIAGAQEVVAGLKQTDRYDLILFQIGANDMLGGASAEQTVERMKGLTSEAASHADQIVIVTSGNIGGVPMFNKTEAERFTDISRTYDELMIDWAKSAPEISFVPLFDEPADDPFLAQPDVYTSIDGLHPTSAGYEIWYSKAKSYFQSALATKE